MKKLSFLELEKEMDLLSEEEAFRTKAGTQPQPGTDCYFQSMDYIFEQLGYDSEVTVGGLEAKFDDRYATTEDPHPSSDGVDLTKTGEFAYFYSSNNFDGITSSSASGAGLLPETTTNAGNQYMAIIKNGSGQGHAVAFDHYNPQNDTYTFWDEQNHEYVNKDSSEVIGVIKFHEDGNAAPSTTMPTSVPPTSPMPN